MQLMGRLGLAELGLIGADAAGRALNEDYARNRGVQDAYEAKFGKNYSISVKEMADELAKTGDIDPLTLREFYGGSGDMDAGPGGPSSLSERTAPAVVVPPAPQLPASPSTSDFCFFFTRLTSLCGTGSSHGSFCLQP